MLIAIVILIVILVTMFFYTVSIYNHLVSLRNRCKNGFSQIDVQLKRRYDLIPNLVESARAYLKHERETLEGVITARNLAADARGVAAANPTDGTALKSLISAEGTLGGALGRLLAVVESYPDLKADSTVRDLMEELTSTENKVSFARQSYNDGVMELNTARESFPSNIIASVFQFHAAQPFEIEDSSHREAPRVSLT